MQFNTLKSARLAAVLGFFTSLAIGCVITVGDGSKTGDCPEINNHQEGEKCFCNTGYSWCDPFDDTDLTCCPNSSDTSNDQTSNPSGNDTTSTLPTTSESQGTDTGNGTTEEPPTSSGTTGDPPADCSVDIDPPGSCDVDMGENYLCLSASNPECGVQGSESYICEGGVWVPDTMSGDESCKFDLGEDNAFSYGCKIENNTVVYECGVGPGTACSGDGASCTTEKDIEYCYLGKLTSGDCLYQCQEIGDDMMVTYDHGYCGEQDTSTVCICCDEGDDGCPINGGTTTDGESTGGTGTTG